MRWEILFYVSLFIFHCWWILFLSHVKSAICICWCELKIPTIHLMHYMLMHLNLQEPYPFNIIRKNVQFQYTIHVYTIHNIQIAVCLHKQSFSTAQQLTYSTATHIVWKRSISFVVFIHFSIKFCCFLAFSLSILLVPLNLWAWKIRKTWKIHEKHCRYIRI